VCFPNQNASAGGSAIEGKTKKFAGYASATHFHNAGRSNGSAASGNQYMDLAGEAISEETINANKQARQLRKMQDMVSGLRENVQRLELEKAETVDALKQVTFVCSNMRNRQKQLDMQLQRSEESVGERDHRVVQLEAQLEVRDDEIRDLKVRCANSEACRSNATKELRLLRQQLQKQTEHMSLFSLPTYRSSGNQMSSLTNADLTNRQPRSFCFSSSGRGTDSGPGAGADEMADFQAVVAGEYEDEDDLDVTSPSGSPLVQGQSQGHFGSWRSQRSGSGDQNAYDARDNDTVTSNTTCNTARTAGTAATNNTTPMHARRTPNMRPAQGANTQTLTQTPAQGAGAGGTSRLEEVAGKIDPVASGIGPNVLTSLVQGVPPNDIIKLNNIRKYDVAGGEEASDWCGAAGANGRGSVPLEVSELGGVESRPFRPDTRMTAQLVRGRTPQEMIKANNLAKFQVNQVNSPSQPEGSR